MIRMVISSFYNTLIDKEEAIPTSTMFEIDRLRQQNKLFAVITNRLLKDVLYYNKDFPFIDYIISLNGSYIYDVNQQKELIKKNLNKKTIIRIQELFPQNKIIYYTEDNYYEDYPNCNIYKMEIEISKKEIDKIKLLKKLELFSSIFQWNKKYYIEITKNSLPNNIKIFLENLRIQSNEVIAVIGNSSEEEIINKIEKTYVVSNAPKELKEKAQYKTKSNEKKGVENILKTVK